MCYAIFAFVTFSFTQKEKKNQQTKNNKSHILDDFGGLFLMFFVGFF